MTNDFDLTDGTMAQPWWSDQLILEVIIHHRDMDDAYADDDTDEDDDDDDHDADDDDADEDIDGEAIWLWWWYWWCTWS